MANNVSTPRKGGQELPDSVQDRPEQNRGYDEAVRGGERAQQQDVAGVGDEEFEDDEDDEEEDEEGDSDPI